MYNLYSSFNSKKNTCVICYQNTPVLHDVQNVQLYRTDIVQYRDEP